MAFEDIIKKLVIWSPLLQVLVLCVGVFASFLSAFYDGDVSIYMPFISETGAVVPEMGIFSATLTYGSIVGAVAIIYRYAILNRILCFDRPNLISINKVAVLAGLVSMVGCCLIAAFPMSTVFAVHFVAAGIHIGFGVIYAVLQAFLSFYIFSPYYSKGLSIFRLVVSSLVTVIAITCATTATIAINRWELLHPDKKSAVKTPDDEGYQIMLTSTVLEWLFFGTFLTFFYTYLREFSMFEPELSVQPTYDFGDTQFKDHDSPILS